MRVNPIEVKRFIIKLNVKDSFSFSVKEIYNNLNLYDKKNDIFRQIDFSLKTDLKISNKTELINITIDNPLFNDKLILNNRQNYVLNDSDIHELFSTGAQITTLCPNFFILLYNNRISLELIPSSLVIRIFINLIYDFLTTWA
jgi:hypothetical protein